MRKKAPTAARRRGGGGVTVLRQGFAKHTRRRRGVGEGRGCALGKVWLPSHPSTIYREKGGLHHHIQGAAPPLPNTSPPPRVLGVALPENCHSTTTTPSCCCWSLLPQPLPPPCWIKKEETSLDCMCVKHGGAVRSVLDRIFRDLNRREYDSINRVLVTLPLSDLQGYEDALPLSRC